MFAWPLNTHLLAELVELLGEGRVHPVAVAARGLAEEAGPDAGQPGLLLQPVSTEHHEPLDVVELTVQVRPGQEYGLLDERDPCLQAQLLRRPLELRLDLF